MAEKLLYVWIPRLVVYSILALVVVLMAGCSTVGPALSPVSDKAVEEAEFVLCRGITIGAWMRAYGNDPNRAEAWAMLCRQPIDITPANAQP